MSDDGVMTRVYSLFASTRLHRPDTEWEWRLSRDVAEHVVRRFGPFATDRSPNDLRTLLGLPVVVMENATPGTIGLVAA